MSKIEEAEDRNPSLKMLQTFIRKISRMLYLNSLSGSTDSDAHMRNMEAPVQEIETNPETRKDTVSKETVSKIIPLVIDYILEYNMAETTSLAQALQLNENYVQNALDKLKKHQILDSKEVDSQHFKQEIGPSLGL
jgi:hypothetical protein